jgi:hypothetical protein
MVLAASGGIDELLMMLAPILTFIVVRRLARGRPADRTPVEEQKPKQR